MWLGDPEPSDMWQIYASNIVSDSDQRGSCGPYLSLIDPEIKINLPEIPQTTATGRDYKLIREQSINLTLLKINKGSK